MKACILLPYLFVKSCENKTAQDLGLLSDKCPSRAATKTFKRFYLCHFSQFQTVTVPFLGLNPCIFLKGVNIKENKPLDNR